MLEVLVETVYAATDWDFVARLECFNAFLTLSIKEMCMMSFLMLLEVQMILSSFISMGKTKYGLGIA